MPHEHAVQFYENPDAFLDSACEFLREGLAAGDAGIVIATEEHRRALEARLAGSVFAGALAKGRYRALDAAETMARFMVGSVPDEERFIDIVGGLIANAGAASSTSRTRAVGEMVALLCAQGLPEAAIRVETLWNELGTRHLFSLFCAYPMSEFAASDRANAFDQISDAHSRVVPVESYRGVVYSDFQARAIAQLQRKAAALEVEVARRREAEAALVRREKELAELKRRKTPPLR